MATNTEELQTALRARTSTTGTLNEDWHALFDLDSIAAGTFNERLLAWLEAKLGTTYDNLPRAKQAYADNQSFYNWDSIDTWDVAAPV